MLGEGRAQESGVRRVVRPRVGVLQLHVGDDRQLILDRLERAENRRQLAERALTLGRPAGVVTPHRDEHVAEPAHRFGRCLSQGGHRGNHRVEQRQRQGGLHPFQERPPW